MRAQITRFVMLAAVLGLVMFAAAGSITPVPTGQWAATTSLSQVRSGAASVLLPDGRILVTGGTDANGNALNSAELFGTDGSVTAAAPMSVARSAHAAIVLYTGDVLVTGGRTSGGGFTNSAELYDPLNNRWSSAGAMVDARAGHTASLLPTDGSVFLVGGENSGGPVAAIERYDMYDNSFSYAGSLASARTGQAAAMLNDGRILIAGGQSSDGNGSLAPTASTEIFDPASGAVSAGPAMTAARAAASATTLLDGKVLIAGGNDGSNDLASTDVFDPVAGTISAGAAMSAPRSGHQAFLLPNNNSVLLVGGTAAGQPLASAELYVPWTGSSSTTGSMSVARTNATGAPLQQDGLLLVAGGDGQQSAELYGFATVKTDNGDYAPGEVVTITGSGWKPGETVTLTLVESPNLDTHPAMTAVADANGDIFNNQFVPDEHDLNVRFYLTAQGSQSGAQNTFTDSVSSVAITSPTSGSPITVTSLPATITVNFNYVTSTTGTTTGQADVVGVNGSTKSLTPGNYSDSINVTIPAGTANGNYNVKVTVTNSTGTGANNKNDIQNGAVIISVPSCTAPSITTQPTTQTVTYNDPVSFSAAASGSPSPTLQWQLSTDNGTTFNNITGATTSPLYFANAQMSQDGNQYRAVFTNTCGTATSAAATLTVNKATATVTVTDPQPTYDGTAKSATIITNPSGLSSTVTYSQGGSPVASPTNAGAYDVSVTINDSNYQGTGTGILTIKKADATITVTAYHVTYDGNPHTAIGTATGVESTPADLSSLLTLSGTTHTDAGDYTADAWTFAGNTNYNSASGNVHDKIDQAPSTTTVTFESGPYVYRGTAFTATAEVTGAGGFSQSLTASYSGDCTNVTTSNGCTAFANFGGDANHLASSGSTSITIVKANANITITPYHVTYDGASHTATGTATGVEPSPADLSSLLTLSGTTHTDAGDYTADAWTFAGNTNYNSASGTVADQIDKAGSTTVVTFEAGPYTYRGTAFTATAQVTGVGGLNQPVSVVYSGDCTNVTAANGCTATATFVGDSNHDGSSDSKSITILKANANITVTPYHVTYDAASHTATGTAVGVESTPADLSGLLTLTGTTHTNAGTYNGDAWSFAGNTNYNSASGTVTDQIDKADATITIVPYTGVYDALPHHLTGTATGVGGADLSSGLNFGASFTDVPGGTATWTFTGGTNYNDKTGTAAVTINKADQVIAWSNPADIVYGTPLGATQLNATVVGVSGGSAPGALTYNPLVGTVLLPGAAQALTVTAAATQNYNLATKTVYINVNFGACPSIGPAGVVLPPINSDGTSVFPRKKGSTIPVKFRVCDANGVSISDANVVFANLSSEMSMIRIFNGTVTTTVNEDVLSTSADSYFRYDSSSQQWIFNLSTNPYTTGYTYDFQINLRANPIVFRVGMR